MNICFDMEANNDDATMVPVRRRGFELGRVRAVSRPAMPGASVTAAAWQQDKAMMLPAIIDVEQFKAQIKQSRRLMRQVLKTEEASPSFDAEPYLGRLKYLPMLATSPEEHDRQGIEKLYFDAENEAGDVLAEGLWCKASWLSFVDEDASLRFRFSFGMEGFEDVAANPVSQQWAGHLCDALFPESAALTEDPVVVDLLSDVLGGEPAFVERIVYFNAPNGGAQMHHDVERGHAGVIYAQLSGSTFWLALAKPVLMDELIAFIRDESNAGEVERLLPDGSSRTELLALIGDRQALSDYMEENDHELVEAVMDRSALFTGYLCGKGYGYILHAGDALLMPQRDLDNCVWHAVTCLGDEPGEALSFALRRKA